ncbi:M14 family metallopeptidase [Aliidiomarina haloalkalitolerans]|uniref:M14 family metallopeptidase n=1 Tax=Aliidiomarina haloalkalitolerans TaxID=859059 RepID=UPI000F86C025|nr:M14 family metallopeptidase [Aliidiomarina haloalkalitolerans]
MKNYLLRTSVVVAAASVMLSACGGAAPVGTTTASAGLYEFDEQAAAVARAESLGHACVFDGVEVRYDFPQARVDGCEQREDGTIVVMTGPENQPINPSPWYAFQVVAAEPQTVALEVLALERGRARYNPKVSTDGASWQDIEHSKSDHSIYFSLDVGPQPVWVAGQEMFGNDDYWQWVDGLAREYELRRFTIGYSAQGRQMPALVSYGSGDEWLVLIGRQHPPELTGAMAMRAFVEEMLSEGAEFLDRYNVLIAPNLNPDGVALGNWRHSTGGLDLNRDWFDRSQPEIAAVHTYLQQIVAEGGDLVYGVDFHSTWRNVYYTMPVDYVARESTFSQEWLQRLGAAVPYEVEEQASAAPGRGIFKQYMADEYGVHSVTYEVGDETDRGEIDTTARAAARVLMQYMLER